MLQALLAGNEAGRETMNFPDFLVKEACPEPISYFASCWSKHSDVWTDSMRSEVNGLEGDETFVEGSELLATTNIAESKWLVKLKGDAHGILA